MADDDPIWGSAARERLRVVGGRAQGVQGVFEGFGSPALGLRAVAMPDAGALAPRPWLYAALLLRGYLTLLVAPGGVGKSALALAWGLCLASGRGLLGDYVHARVNVAFLVLEDSFEEFQRRLAAAMQLLGIDPEDVGGRIFILVGHERRLVMAAVSGGGWEVVHPDQAALTAALRAHDIGAVFVDPIVNSYDLNENDNPQMNALARAWIGVATDANCAVVAIQHSRKGFVAGDMDAGRGASALAAAARVVVTLAPMTETEADQFAIPRAERRRYVRLDDAKGNLAPPAERAAWHFLESVALGNPTPDYPRGDHVQAVRRWEPPSVWGAHTPDVLNAALDVIAEGPAPGVRFTASRRGGGSRWAGSVLVERLGVSDEQAAQMVRAWIKSGLLAERAYFDAEQRKSRQGIEMDDAKRPST